MQLRPEVAAYLIPGDELSVHFSFLRKKSAVRPSVASSILSEPSSSFEEDRHKFHCWLLIAISKHRLKRDLAVSAHLIQSENSF